MSCFGVLFFSFLASRVFVLCLRMQGGLFIYFLALLNII